AIPGPAEGAFYVSVFRDSGTINQGNLRAGFLSQSNPGDLIVLSFMLYLPSSSDVDARAQLILDNGDFSSARAWARPDGAGHVEALVQGPGNTLITQSLSLTYSTDLWQEWDLAYVIGSGTFSVTVGGSTVSSLTSFTNGAVSAADLFNGV